MCGVQISPFFSEKFLNVFWIWMAGWDFSFASFSSLLCACLANQKILLEDSYDYEYSRKDVALHPSNVVSLPVISVLLNLGEGKHMCAIKGVKISSLIDSIAKSL